MTRIYRVDSGPEKCLSPRYSRDEERSFSKVWSTNEKPLYFIMLAFCNHSLKKPYYQGFKRFSHHAAPKVRVCNIFNALCVKCGISRFF